MTNWVPAALALCVTLGVALGWKHRFAAPIGAWIGVLVLIVSGHVVPHDVADVATVMWRPLLTVAAIVTMTACAHQLGLIDRLAAMIEPRTRGPVRHAFRVVFVIAALTATVLSNDAAILLVTPTVITLIRQVYPRRYPKLFLPFSLAVFYAAGVAPFATSNPMNLVVAEQAGIGFNGYAMRMIPVAVAGWVVGYLVLARLFKDILDDDEPAPGRFAAPPPLTLYGFIVLATLLGVLLAYPVVSLLDGPLWLVALSGAIVCMGAAAASHVPTTRVVREISWEILPFLAAVVVIALGLTRAGVVDWLAALYRSTPMPDTTSAAVASMGSAVLNNHPMALLNLAAVRGAGGDEAMVLAGLIGGDLGPRLLPIGSLAGLLWLDILRQHRVRVPLRYFVRHGVIVTVPTLVVSLIVLWIMTR